MNGLGIQKSNVFNLTFFCPLTPNVVLWLKQNSETLKQH